jgi:hypothetical protein
MILNREQTLCLRAEHQVPEALYRAIDDVGTTWDPRRFMVHKQISRCDGVDDVKMLTQLVATDRNSVGRMTLR